MLPRLPSLTLALLLAFPPLASAQLRFTKPTADLGELRSGPVYQCRFDFVNDAREPIEITDIRLGCGCLRPVLSKRVFQPGEESSIPMQVRTLGQPNGNRTWQAHVQYRLGGKVHESTLVVAANVRNEVTIEPAVVALTVETTLKQELTIKDHRSMPLKITSVLASSPAIKVATQQLEGGVTKITLEVSRADLTSSRHEETLNIYSDDPDYRHLQVPITLIKTNRNEVSATPDKIEISGSGAQLVRLRAAGDKTVRIESAEADHAAIKCTWAAGPGNDATLKINVNAAQLTATTARVRIQVAEPSPMTITIPVIIRKD